MAFLRIKRPEGMKEHSPGELGACSDWTAHRRGENPAQEARTGWPIWVSQPTLAGIARRLRPTPRGRPRRGDRFPVRRWPRAPLPRHATPAQRQRGGKTPGDAGHYRLLGQRPAGRPALCGHHLDQPRLEPNARFGQIFER